MKKQNNELSMFPYVAYETNECEEEKRQQPYIPPRSSWNYYRKYGQLIVSQKIIKKLKRFDVAEYTEIGEKNGTLHNFTFNLMLSKPAVHVLCLRRNPKNGKIETCMVLEPRGARTATVDGKQYARFFWGVPAGLIEKGETMEEGAYREAQEEIGYEIQEIQPLVQPFVHLHISCSTETLKLFVARVGQKTQQNLDENECIRYKWYSVERVEQELEDYLEGKKPFLGFDLAEVTILLLQRFFTKLHRGDFEGFI